MTNKAGLKREAEDLQKYARDAGGLGRFRGLLIIIPMEMVNILAMFAAQYHTAAVEDF